MIISLVFFYLCKVLFSGFLQFNGNFVDDQNNSKHSGCAALVVSTWFIAFKWYRYYDKYNLIVIRQRLSEHNWPISLQK